MSMKNSNDTIGNRLRDLPVCSAVPQPTGPPAACPTAYNRQSVIVFSLFMYNCKHTKCIATFDCRTSHEVPEKE
jgi:hypothetical protein